MARSLTDFFTLYRAGHPVGDERVRLIVAGLPAGAPRRTRYRVWAAGLALVAVPIVLGWVPALSLWLVVAPLLGGLAAAVATPARDRAIGLMLTDHRVIVAQQRRRGGPVVLRDLPHSALEQAVVDLAPEPAWLGLSAIRVTFRGAGGDVLAVDLVRVDRDALRILLNDADLPVAEAGPSTGAASPGPVVQPDPDPWWLLKAFPVGLLFAFGGASVLLAGPMAIEQGWPSGAVSAAIGVFLLVGGEALRRRLFRTRRRSPPTSAGSR